MIYKETEKNALANIRAVPSRVVFTRLCELTAISCPFYGPHYVVVCFSTGCPH